MNELPVISILTLIPIIGGAALLLMRGNDAKSARTVALVFSALALFGALWLWTQFDLGLGELQFVERHDWIPVMGIQYFVGVDGLGLLTVLLASLVVPFAMMVSRPAENPRLFFALLLFLQAGLFGTFTALSFFHWFIFWELSLIPAFFLIKLWGGPRRTAAAFQFFVYTMVGSVPMLLGFLALYSAAGTFDFIQLAELAASGELAGALGAGSGWALLVFVCVAFGFAVKIPIFPFHTWLPAAYAEAPTGVSMVLTGVMSKMGVYGLLRILLPIFPDQMQQLATPLLWFAVATIVFSVFAALAQTDLKRMIAYSSINHLGYCLLGVFAAASLVDNDVRLAGERAAALNGVMLQMFNHGITASALFCFIGLIERRSGGLRGLNEFGGLRKVAPIFCGLMGIALFSSLGLPGLNSFVGEFLIFKGSFPLASWATAISTLGLLMTALLMLTILQRVFNGPLNEKWAGFADLTARERMIVAPAIALMFVIGIYPQLVMELINPVAIQLAGSLNIP
jgi:NADH-quinone oxidoreductase subunit M